MEQEKNAAPGLKWRPRADGRKIPVWCARPAAIAAGFPLKTVNLSDTPLDMLPARCERLWAEMLDFMGQSKRPGYDGTIGALIDVYTTAPESPYQKLKASSLHPYRIYAAKIKAMAGARRVDALTGLDVMRWHEIWRHPQKPGGKPLLGAATMALNVLKAALAFGQICGFRECAELLSTTKLLTLPRPRSREEAPEAQDIERAREAAHALGKHRAALCYALQFDTTARQWDLIGEWVPLDDPRPSTVLGYGKKWIGLTWASIASGVLSIMPSKTFETTRARVSVNLSLCPMVQEEMALVPPAERTGPLIVNEGTGLPYLPQEFAVIWRKVRKKAELSPTLWNRDIRAGGITEGGIAGASADDRAKVAGHSSSKTTRAVYDRDVIVASDRVAEARAKFRRGE
jgi:hypothetical protein